MINYEFTFKTDAEYLKARFSGFIPEYKMLRVTIEKGSNIYEFPIHSEEEFHEIMKRHKHNVIDIYLSTTFYEWDK